MPSSATVSAAERRLLFCEKDGLSDGPHVITVNVSVQPTDLRLLVRLYTVSSIPQYVATYLGHLFPSIRTTRSCTGSMGRDGPQFFPGNMTGKTSTFSFEFGGDFHKIYVTLISRYAIVRNIHYVAWFLS